MWLPSTRTMPKPRLAAPGSIPITTCMQRDSGARLGCLPEATLGAGSRISSGMSKLAWTSLTSSWSSRASTGPAAPWRPSPSTRPALRLHRQSRTGSRPHGVPRSRSSPGRWARRVRATDRRPPDVSAPAFIAADHVVLAVAAPSTTIDAAFLEDPGDRAGLAEAAPCLLKACGRRPWCGCGCRSAPRPGSPRRRARTLEEGLLDRRSAVPAPVPRSIARWMFSLGIEASWPSGSRWPGSGFRRGPRPPRARRP